MNQTWQLLFHTTNNHNETLASRWNEDVLQQTRCRVHDAQKHLSWIWADALTTARKNVPDLWQMRKNRKHFDSQIAPACPVSRSQGRAQTSPRSTTKPPSINQDVKQHKNHIRIVLERLFLVHCADLFMPVSIMAMLCGKLVFLTAMWNEEAKEFRPRWRPPRWHMVGLCLKTKAIKTQISIETVLMKVMTRNNTSWILTAGYLWYLQQKSYKNAVFAVMKIRSLLSRFWSSELHLRPWPCDSKPSFTVPRPPTTKQQRNEQVTAPETKIA